MTEIKCCHCSAHLRDEAQVHEHMKLAHQAADSFVCADHHLAFSRLDAFQAHWNAAHFEKTTTGQAVLDEMHRHTLAALMPGPSRDNGSLVAASPYDSLSYFNTKAAVWGLPPSLTEGDRLRRELAERAHRNGMSVGWCASTFDVDEAVLVKLLTKGGKTFVRRGSTDEEAVRQAEATTPGKVRKELAAALDRLSAAAYEVREVRDQLQACGKIAGGGMPPFTQKDKRMAQWSPEGMTVSDLVRAGKRAQDSLAELRQDAAGAQDAEEDLRDQVCVLQKRLAAAMRTAENARLADKLDAALTHQAELNGPVWNSARGPVLVKDMKDDHLQNALGLLERNARSVCRELRCADQDAWRVHASQPIFDQLVAELRKRQPVVAVAACAHGFAQEVDACPGCLVASVPLRTTKEITLQQYAEECEARRRASAAPDSLEESLRRATRAAEEKLFEDDQRMRVGALERRHRRERAGRVFLFAAGAAVAVGLGLHGTDLVAAMQRFCAAWLSR